MGFFSAALLASYIANPGDHRGDDLHGRIRAAQLTALARFSPAVMIASIFNASVLLTALLASGGSVVGLVWSFVAIGYAMFVYLHVRRHQDRNPARLRSRRAIVRAITNAAVIGCLWGLVPVLFFKGTETQLIVCCLAIGMMCAGCFVLATVPLAALAFLVPMVAGIGIAMIRQGDAAHLLVVFLFASYVFVLMAGIVQHASSFVLRVLGQVGAEQAATIDPLTGVFNRKGLLAHLDSALVRGKRNGAGFALLSLDLDGFKPVNDRFGHAAGDRLLIDVSQRLASSIREGDAVARVGGDEFVLFLADVSEAALAAEIADRILSLFTAPFALEGELVAVQVSAGIAMAPSDGNDADVLLANADSALYEVKRAAKNGYRLYRPEDDATVRHRKALSLDLRRAVARGEMSLAFQPIVQLATGRVASFEALLRWTHGEQGPVSPVDFIGLAEKSGLIHEIGAWVMDAALSAAKELPSDVRMAVNVSLDQFRRPDFVGTTLDALERHCVDASRLEIEVTESVLFQDEDAVLAAIRSLDEAGIQIVLDDFGTGFSSLRHLQELPIGGLKIDRSFVAGLGRYDRSAGIVQGILSLCRTIGIDATVEGIETKQQLAALRALGCQQGQGYLLGRPASLIVAQTITVEPLAVLVA